MIHPLQDSEMRETFLKQFKCIQSDCDGNGNIPVLVSGIRQVSETECEQTQDWEAEQCQFCAEYRFPVADYWLKVLSSEKEKWIRGEMERLGFVKEFEIKGDAFEKQQINVAGYNRAIDDQFSHLQQQLDLLTKE